jgi:transcriptional regulator
MVGMYVPAKFRVDDDDAWRIVTDAGAATLVLATSEGLVSAFAPVIVSEDRRVLYSHLARANPWWQKVTPEMEVLAIFVAASAYVSPSDYPSRSENPNVVPTWNYAMAQVHGKVRLHEDAGWKLDQVRALTHQFEHGRTPEWQVDDMDEKYRSSQLKAIIGIEIEVVGIEGKAKLSQNRPEIDQKNVRALFAEGTLEQQIVASRMKTID